MSSIGTTGFVNGCFDVLHFGHLRLLEYAKSRSDFLIVAIDSDTRVRNNKGPNRPCNNQQIREYFLSSLRFVDSVEVFETDKQLEGLVAKYSPDIMVVGSDYKDRNVIGSKHAKRVEFFEKINGYSTTQILQHTSDR